MSIQTFPKFNILDHVHKLVPAKGKNRYICPVCEGNNLTVEPNAGKYRCWNDCECEDIRDAIAPLPKSEPKAVRPKANRTFVYTNRQDDPRIRVRRTDDGKGNRQIWQEYRHGKLWQRNVPDAIKAGAKKQIAPYRYLECLKAKEQGQIVLLVEDESCADALWAIDIAATTTIGGSSGWKSYGDYSKDFQGFDLAICPDRDLAGIKYAEAVVQDYPEACWLYAYPDSQWWNRLPKDGGLDVKDWIEDGATKEQILGAIEERRSTRPEVEPQELEWRCLDSYQCQIGSWSKEVEFSKPHDVSDWKQKAKSNPVGVEIRISSEDGQEVAWVKFFNPKADFDFSVSKLLTASDGGGLVLTLKRVESGHVVEIEAYIRSSETGQVKDFINALKRETGRNLSCTLKYEELQALIQSRTSRYRKGGGRTYRLAPVTGRQEDGTCVFFDRQFAADGSPTTEHDSGWVFNHQLGEEEKIPSPKIAPQNPEALKALVAACQGFFSPDVLPLALFCCGYSTATLQRQDVMHHEGNFPQLALFGDPGGGKTTAAQVATSLTAMHKTVLSRFSESLVYEHVKSLGGLTLLLDDPVKKGVKRDSRDAIDNFLWAMFNGTTRNVIVETRSITSFGLCSTVQLGRLGATNKRHTQMSLLPRMCL